MRNKISCKEKSIKYFFGQLLLTLILVLINSTIFYGQCDLACNDEITVSLGDSCMMTLTPDQVLEGETCPGEALFVEIEDQYGNIIGDKLGSMHIGQVLKVSVRAELGNNCWGKVLVEDKLGPPLVCDTVYTTCTGDLTPGSPVAKSVSYAAEITTSTIPADATFTEAFEIKVFGIDSANILDIDFLLDLEHENLNDLEVILTSPMGTVVNLIPSGSMSSTCNSGMMVTLDDDADLTLADFTIDCQDGQQKIGRFQASESLDGLTSEEVKGIWTVQVSDSDATEGGIIKKLVLILEQEDALVRFPGRGYITGVEIGDNTFELAGLDPCGTAIATYTDKVIDQSCTTPIDKIIERTWNAIDEQGNQAIPCTQLIYVYRNDLSTLVLPPHYDGRQEAPLSCVDFANMVPDSSVTGYPTGDFCDKVQIFPITDKIIDICPGSYKVLRKFQILEWCTSELIEYTQVIKVEDTIGPTLSGIEDITISALPFECRGEYKVPKPIVYDACSDSFDFQLSYQHPDVYGHFDETRPFITVHKKIIDGEYYLTDLPIGTTMVKWKVTDKCHQATDSVFLITVEDQVPPVAVCDEFTVVSLGGDGTARVPAFTFNDISHDNCEIERFEARKMTDKCNIDNDIFRDTITFCCAEAGESIQVSFRVVDQSGNSNTCMVQVRVEDKLPPYIKHCPDDITLDCFEEYTDLAITGNIIEGVDAFDNCEIVSIDFEDAEDIDKCGEGIVRRTWTVEDGQGLKHSCEQYITLKDMDPFDKDNIIYPLDYSDTICAADLHVENLDTPYVLTVEEDYCNLVAISWKDQPFYIVQDACIKILREWTVIDWCTYDNKDDNRSGIYTYLQVLKVKNQTPPEILNCQDMNIPAYNSDCTGDINFGLQYRDECTPDNLIEVYYEVDLGNDGTFTDRVAGDSINSVWPIGEHLVKWIVEDKCGNIATCKQVFTVEDQKRPTPYCITSITTAVMNNNGMVEVWARDFDFGSNDNCTEKENLLFTFNGEYPVKNQLYSPHYFKGQGISATLDEYLAGEAQQWLPKDHTSGRIFDCEDVPNGEEGIVKLDISVWDEEENTDFCSIELVLQDNEAGACHEMEGIIISGRVTTASSANLKTINIFLSSSRAEMNDVIKSDQDGNYNFSGLLPGVNYYLDGEYEDDPVNGVNTLDIVKIQRHLLGITPFENPLQIIAADADNSEYVSARDLVVLRKLILGITDKFGNGQKSWRFIDKDYVFGDNVDPFPYPDGLEISQPGGNMVNQDLLGVKIGDVDGDVLINAREDYIKPRSKNVFTLQIPEIDIDDIGEIIIPVYAKQSSDLLGLQFTLDYDPSMLRFVDIIPAMLQVNETNIGSMYEKDGILTFSWNDTKAIMVDDNIPLFELRYEILEQHDLALGINSAITDAEAYNARGNRMDLLLEQKNAENILLLQNTPNPFSDITRIDFRLPKDMHVTLDVTDAAGKLVRRITGQYTAGYNTIEIDADDLDASGLLYYTLTAGQYIISKKMIKL